MRLFSFAIILLIHVIELQSQTVEPIHNPNERRTMHEAQRLINGKILIFGGNNKVNALKTGELYNPATGKWAASGAMNTERSTFASEILNDGRILAIGGINTSLLKSCEIYVPNKDEWVFCASLHNARSGHKSVKLHNGTVLVAGGKFSNKECEIYDPFLDQWFHIGNMNFSHSNSLSLTLLNNGYVLATGSSPENLYDAEIFNPKTLVWEVVPNNSNYIWFEHSSITLNNGEVLLIGRERYETNAYSELFDPVTKTFSKIGELQLYRDGIQPIKLDNGNVLVWGVSSKITGNEYNAISVYSIENQSWSFHPTGSKKGSKYYCIKKINNGGYLISGGLDSNNELSESFTIPSDENDCVYKDNIIQVNESSVCYGKTIEITIENSLSKTNYQIYNTSGAISSITPGGGNISFSVTKDDIAKGINQLHIMASKKGCISSPLNRTIEIVSIDNNSVPSIQTQDETICQGNSTYLSSKSNLNLIWNTGNNQKQIPVSQQGYYFAQSVDALGCQSLASDKIFIEVLPTPNDVHAGYDSEICASNDTIQLYGEPKRGYWEGEGIVYPDKLDIGELSPGTYELMYNYCGWRDIKKLTVIGEPEEPDFYVEYNNDSVCLGNAVQVFISNLQDEVEYKYYINGEYIQSINKWSFWTKNLFKNSELTIKGTTENKCFSSVHVQKDSFIVIPKPKILLDYGSMNDTICIGTKPILYVAKPENNITYQAFYVKDALSALSMPSNQDTLFIPTNYKMKQDEPVTLTIEAKNILGCSQSYKLKTPIVPFQPDMKISPSDEGQYPGELVTLYNNSNTTYHEWIFDPKIEIIKDNNREATITANRQGKYEISLIGNSKFGCSDTTNQFIEFYPQNNNFAFQKACKLSKILNNDNPSTFSDEMDHVLAYHTDNFGNTYFSTHYISNNSKICEMNIHKIKNGEIVWTIKPTFPAPIKYGHSFSIYCNSITSDKQGNIYTTGSFSCPGVKLSNISIAEDFAESRVHFYSAKFDADGNLLWWIASEEQYDYYQSNLTHAGTHIQYVDDENIYIGVVGKLQEVTFTDKKFTNLSNSTYTILKINNKGEYLDHYSGITNSVEKNLLAKYSEPYLTYSKLLTSNAP